MGGAGALVAGAGAGTSAPRAAACGCAWLWRGKPGRAWSWRGCRGVACRMPIRPWLEVVRSGGMRLAWSETSTSTPRGHPR
jgi:hypothetical protein